MISFYKNKNKNTEVLACLFTEDNREDIENLLIEYDVRFGSTGSFIEISNDDGVSIRAYINNSYIVKENNDAFSIITKETFENMYTFIKEA